MANKKQVLCMAIAVMTMALTFSGCSGSQSKSSNSSPKGLTVVKYVLPRSPECLDDAHVIAADKMGYFKQQGIQIQFEQAMGTSDVKMVATGKGDIAIPSPGVLLTSLQAGLPVISVYQVDVRNIFDFAVKGDSGIKTIADLKGKTIVLGDASWSAISDPILQHAGLDPKKDVKYVVAGDNRAQLTWEGKADAVLTWEKEYQLWEGQGMTFTILKGSDVLQNCSNSAIVSLDTYKNKPELIKKFFTAYAMGSYFTKNNPEAATEMVIEKYPGLKVDWKSAVAAVKALASIDNNDDTVKYGYGYHNADAWNLNVADDLKNNIITSSIPLSKIFTNKFVSNYNSFNHKNVEQDSANYKLKTH
jgi:NitT/TauT family transport system substrate-binding protein